MSSNMNVLVPGLRTAHKLVTTVQAVRLTEENFRAVMAWVELNNHAYVPWTGTDATGVTAMSISPMAPRHPESVDCGDMNAPVGDWVIFDEADGFYVCTNAEYEARFNRNKESGK